VSFKKTSHLGRTSDKGADDSNNVDDRSRCSTPNHLEKVSDNLYRVGGTLFTKQQAIQAGIISNDHPSRPGDIGAGNRWVSSKGGNS
jgi:hypothetical protein